MRDLAQNGQSKSRGRRTGAILKRVLYSKVDLLDLLNGFDHVLEEAPSVENRHQGNAEGSRIPQVTKFHGRWGC